MRREKLESELERLTLEKKSLDDELASANNGETKAKLIHKISQMTKEERDIIVLLNDID